MIFTLMVVLKDMFQKDFSRQRNISEFVRSYITKDFEVFSKYIPEIYRQNPEGWNTLNGNNLLCYLCDNTDMNINTLCIIAKDIFVSRPGNIAYVIPFIEFAVMKNLKTWNLSTDQLIQFLSHVLFENSNFNPIPKYIIT